MKQMRGNIHCSCTESIVALNAGVVAAVGAGALYTGAACIVDMCCSC